MSIVRINAITVPSERGNELAARFSSRAHEVDQAEGFEGFELLRPTDERTTWLVVTRWRDAEAFEAWLGSQAFQEGHRHAGGSGGPVGVGSELWSYEPVKMD